MKKNKIARWFALLFLVGGAVAVLVACGGGDPGTREQPLGLGAGSTIAWTPGSITFSMNPGGRQDIPVTFTSSAALSNVTVQVVPELRSIVSVNPTSFASLAPGQSATVTVTVSPSAAESLRLVQGTIRLVVGTSTVAKPLPVSLTLVAPETINGVSVPPEPPPDLNNATLAGFDTNGNGVRDDVERWITSSATSSARQRANLFEHAKATNAGLLASTSEQALAAAKRSASAISCFRYLGIPIDQRKWKDSVAITVNTEARLMAYDALQRRLSGEVFSIPSNIELRTSCKFDVESLPN